jgi:hypothetical protein
MKDIAINAPTCIYRLEGGLVLFSETAIDDGVSITFDGKQTAILTTVMLPDGRPAVNAERMENSAFSTFTGKLVVSKSHITAIQNTANKTLLDNVRTAISGIAIYKEPPK